ncbi:MAG: hypothetical protein ACOX68_06065 [Candidatus Limivicinus sp.]|jgi:hypothetical protein
MSGRYDDIIDLPHHQSEVHPRMSMHDRAAQFSPFSALTGHEEAISETARLTDSRIELSEDARRELNDKLVRAAETAGSGAVFSFTFFVPDRRKDGGAYRVKTGSVRKIDPVTGTVQLTDRSSILINDIVKIESDIFKDD